VSVATPASRLKALAASALIGTDRGGVSGKPGNVLNLAAMLGAQARAGFSARQLGGRVSPCPPESCPVAAPAPSATLMRLLGDPDAGLITEWAELAHAKNVRVADSMVPALLDWWSRQPKRPDVVFSVLGKRGEWFASLNVAWRKPIAGSEIPGNADELWQTGKTPERVALLLRIRRHDPALALALLLSTWAKDGADERRRFLEICTERCSIVDEPFLEATLDDKSKVVRRAAAGVLGRIPGSRFRARMNERAKSMIVVEGKRGLLKRGVKVSLAPPQDFDKAWERDGIEEQAASGMGKRAWWMRQILSAADLSVWTDLLGMEPAGVLESMAGDDYFGNALEAVSEGAASCGDAGWCTAIVRCRLAGKKVEVQDLQALWQNLTPEQREPLLLETAGHKRFTGAERWAILASAEHRWSRAFSGAALKLMHSPRKGEAWSVYEPVERVSRWIAPEFAEQFAETVAAMFPEGPTESFKKSIDRVRLRAHMHKEFAS
jgi:hypothetical protein